VRSKHDFYLLQQQGQHLQQSKILFGLVSYSGFIGAKSITYNLQENEPMVITRFLNNVDSTLALSIILNKCFF